MRTVLNISLPAPMADLVREEVKSGNYASVSEFVRELLREWSKSQALRELRKSQKEMKAGKEVLLKSLKDLR